MSAWLAAAVLAGLAGWFLVPHPALRLDRAAPAARKRPETSARALLGRLRRRRQETMLGEELADALDFLAVCLDAGHPMARAVASVAEVSPAATRAVLAGVAEGLALGRAGPAAWAELRRHPVWGRVAADAARAERSGVALAATLRVHADDARQDARDARVKAARTVGVRSVVPLMVCFLPAFVLIGVVPIIAGLLAGFFG